jgi:hypothetical protein
MKTLYFRGIGVFCLFLLTILASYGQGCVAIRSGCGANVGGGALLPKGQWQMGTNLRYFHSYKHFRGKHEETERVEQGTEVINNSFFLDLQLSYGINDRLSVNMVVPFVKHDRSSMYEHGGNPPNGLGDRHVTKSAGLADIRAGVSYWMMDPSNHSNANFALGVGIKLPSGNYRAEDTFYNQGEDRDQTISSGVDQSIQPGDGGFGFTFEAQGFATISDRVTLTANLYYLLNPREYYTLQNRGRSRDYSVPDQYAVRLGGLYMSPFHGLSFYGGVRMEAIPSSDLIGGDEGFRRPGYVVSLEPGVSYALRNMAFNLTVPIAVERNRTKNFSDKQNGNHGDAAFADYLINFGFAFRFGGSSSPEIDSIPKPININQ